MKKIKLEKGITLIALIITIIILLILAVVTIGSIKESKIVDYAQDAANEYTIGQEKEQIGLALSEWQIEKYTGEKSFKDVVTSALNGIATVEENVDGSLTVTIDKTGNQYIATDDGKVELKEKTISLSDKSLTILKEKTKTITATVTGGLKVEDITYSSSNKSVATVTQDGVITAVKVGETTITATCGSYSATCKVTVREANDLDYYFFGQKLKGRVISEILNTNTGVFSDDPLTAPNESDINVISILNKAQEGSIGTAYFKYQGNSYKARADMSTGITDPDYGVVLIYEQSEISRVGETVQYDNKLWTIIYDDDTNGLQMVSNSVYNYNTTMSAYDKDTFYLGYHDELIADWNKLNTNTKEFKISDTDNDGVISNKNDEKSLYSYNKAIETLNKACRNLFVDSSNNFKNSKIKDVRCVGSNPISINSENETLYTSENLEQWPMYHASYTAGIINGRAKGADQNYVSDMDRICALNKMKAYDSDGNAVLYWLASRVIEEDSENIRFCIRGISGWATLYNNSILKVDDTYISGSKGEESYLRPVICLKSDAVLTTSSTDGVDYILE